MQKRLSWIFSIGSFLLGLGVLIYIFGKKDFAFTQNTFYHIQMARSYAHGITNFATTGILKHSIFEQVFIDQHIFYNLFLIPFLIFFPGFIATKIAMAFLLAIVTFLLQRVLRKVLPDFEAMVWSVVFLFVNGNAMLRIFWERPAPINFIALLVIILLSQKNIRSWWWLLIGYAFSMVSFETAFIVASFGCFFLFDFKKTRWDSIAFLIGGVALSFVLAPFPLQKIRYFAELLHYNLFVERNVREWQSMKEPTGTMGLSLAFLMAASLWTWFKGKSSDAVLSFRNRLVLISFGLLIISVEVTRFAYLFCLFAFILVFWVLSEALNSVSRERHRSWLRKGFLIVFVVFAGATAVNMKRNFKGDSGTARNLTKFAAWYNASDLRGQPILLMSWEYWSPLFYYDRTTKAEPGFSMFIYDEKDSNRARNLAHFWSEPENFTWPETKKLFDSFDTDYLLIEKSHGSYNTIKQSLGFLQKIYEDEHFELLKLTPPLSSTRQEDTRNCQRIAQGGISLNEYRFFLNLGEMKKPVSLKKAPTAISFGVLERAAEQNVAASLHPYLRGEYRYLDRVKNIFVSPEEVGRSGKHYNQYELYHVYQCNRVGHEIISSRVGLNPERPLKAAMADGVQDSLDFLSRLIEENKELPYMFEEKRISTDWSSSTFIRINLGVWALCEQRQLFKSNFPRYQKYSNSCHLALDSAYRKMNASTDHQLGEWATLALSYVSLRQNLDWSEERERQLKLIHQTMLSYYDPKTGVLHTDLNNSGREDSSDLFSYGEALVYFITTSEDHKLPLENLVEAYWNSYQKSQNVFYIRWLSTVLAEMFKKTGNEVYATRFTELFNRAANELISWSEDRPDLKGCPYGEMKGAAMISIPHHMAGLFLEGFVDGLHLKRSDGIEVLNHEKIQGMFTCVARLQREAWNLPFSTNKSSSLGGIPLNYLNNELKADLQGHVTMAMGKYLQWDSSR